MARHNNAITFGNAFNISAESPIDSRMLVDTVTDLHKKETWPDDKSPIFKGMTVTTADTGCIYVLTDTSKYTIPVGQSGSGWKKLPTTDEISLNSVGKKTPEGGEIFNEYTNNKAGENAHAEGYNNQAIGESSHVEGENTIAFGWGSHAEGIHDDELFESQYKQVFSKDVDYNTLTAEEIKKVYDLGIGFSMAFGYGSHIEGCSTLAIGENSHAEGYSQTFGNYSHAEGSSTANGEGSHAEGWSIANGDESHAEGWSIANGDESHAEGDGSHANGYYSHAEGRYSITNGIASHAEGGYEDNYNNIYIINTDLQNNKLVIVNDKFSNTIKVKDNIDIADNYSIINTIDVNVIPNSDYNSLSIICNSVGEYYNEPFNKQIPVKYANHNKLIVKGDLLQNIKYFIYNNSIMEITKSEIQSPERCTYFIRKWYGNPIETFKDKVTSVKITNNIICNNGVNISTTKSSWTNTSTNTTVYSPYSIYDVTAFNFNNAEFYSDEECSILIGESERHGATTIEEPISDPVNILITIPGENVICILPHADGDFSHIEGKNTITNGKASHAEGNATTANGETSHTEGNKTITAITAFGSHAEGKETEAHGTGSHVEGFRTKTTDSTGKQKGIWAHAEGQETKAYKNNAHAEGFKSEASNMAAHAEGQETNAGGKNAHAEGYKSVASNDNAHAEGQGTIASGLRSHAEGLNNTASNDGAHAEGGNSSAEGQFSHVEGGNNLAQGYSSHAEGNNTKALGKKSHAEGYGSKALGDNAHAEGEKTNAIGKGSHAEGFGYSGNDISVNINITNYSTEENRYSKITVSEGINYFNLNKIYLFNNIYCKVKEVTETTVQFDKIIYNIKIGKNVNKIFIDLDGIAYGDYSHAEGYSSTANVWASHAEGDCSTANGGASHAEGYSSTANGGYSHAEGSSTANEDYSHAEGYHSTSNGWYSHAEGHSTANGWASHAEGYSSTADGDFSHAEGCSSTANNEAEHAEGQYNISNKVADNKELSTQSSIGIGDRSVRKNALEVMQNGDIYAYGIGNYKGQLLDTVDEDGNGSGNKLPDVKSVQEIINNVLDGTTSVGKSGDSDKLGNQLPSYYASAADLTEVKNTAASALKFKGVKSTITELNAETKKKQGDVWQVIYKDADAASIGSPVLNAEFAYDGKKWVELGSLVDLTNYVTNDTKAGNTTYGLVNGNGDYVDINNGQITVLNSNSLGGVPAEKYLKISEIENETGYAENNTYGLVRGESNGDVSIIRGIMSVNFDMGTF